jgi:hypothetical protein
MRSERRALYIVGPAYDWLFFLLPPTLALGLGVAISETDFSEAVFDLAGRETTWAELSLGALIHAHLGAVIVRSHLNPEIRRRHPYRFFVVPVLLWLAIASSGWGIALATVVATFWDVWHSGAQTFGFARIYDRNAGNPPEAGRRLDFALQQLLYAGPILAGVALVDHLDSFQAFEDVGAWVFTSVPAHASGIQSQLTAVVVTLGGAFLLYYVAAYAKLARRGYRFPVTKVFLVVTTGACSIYCWAFNSWGEAFFVMNLFHAVQYLAFVWAMEGRRFGSRLEAAGRRAGSAGALGLFLGGAVVYGVWAQTVDAGDHALWAITMVVSIMHFWYDGFVWSVRRAEV